MDQRMELRLVERDNYLICRESEKESVFNALRQHPKNEPYVHYFHGISGVGKSCLCDYIRMYIPLKNEANFVLLNLDVGSDMTEAQVIHQFYRQLSKEIEFFFPRYELANNYIYAVTNDAAYQVESLSTSISKFVNFTGEGISSLAEISFSDNPVVPIVINKVCTLLGKGATQIITDVVHIHWEKELQPFISELTRKPTNDIKRSLTEYFIADVNSVLSIINEADPEREFHLIFIVDGFEKRPHDQDIDWFFPKIVSKIYPALWFIFGTETSKQINHDQINNFWIHKLKPFDIKKDEDKLCTYLHEQGIHNRTIQKQILKQSDGLPAAIQILIDVYRNNNSHFDFDSEIDGYHELFEHFFNNYLSAEDKKVLKRLALFDKWDITTFEHIISTVEQNIHFMELMDNSALVMNCNSQTEYQMVDIVRKTLISLLENSDSKAELFEAYSVKYSYYKDKATNLLKTLV